MQSVGSFLSVIAHHKISKNTAPPSPGTNCVVLSSQFYTVGQKVCPRLHDSASDCGGEFSQPKTHFFGHLCTGLPNKVCPRLRDSACWRSGKITQPRTSLIREREDT